MSDDKKPKVGDRKYAGVLYTFQDSFTNAKDMEKAREELKASGHSVVMEKVAGGYGLRAIKREGKPAKAEKPKKEKKPKKERKSKKPEAPATPQEAPAPVTIEEGK